MSGYRPITDIWILARPKVKYYGAYPSGFLERARNLLGVSINDSVLHVCAGRVRDYPFRGVGPADFTQDADAAQEPDIHLDVVKHGVMPGKSYVGGQWATILADPPYTAAGAEHYAPGAQFPKVNALLADCLEQVRPGGRVGILHYEWPRPPKSARSVAVIGVLVGFSNRIRCFSVFERAA